MDNNNFVSNYRGSKNTYEAVKTEIERRWGQMESERYDPLKNCLTFKSWLSRGYVVKKGEKSIRSITYIEKKDKQGNVIRTYPKTVHLFFITQVQKFNS